MADAAHGMGENLAGMERRKVAFYTPMESSLPQPGNPACREAFRVPVPEEDWPKLLRNPQKQLDKSCFVYEEQEDRYWCPMGQVLEFATTEKAARNERKSRYVCIVARVARIVLWRRVAVPPKPGVAGASTETRTNRCAKRWLQR